MAALRRSLVINFFASSGTAVLQFGVSVILARILSPSEIGVYSMTIVFVNIAHIFRDFGVTTYIQRESELTAEKIRSAIGVMFATAWLIALFLFVASGWLAAWFKEPQIAPVMQVLALGFLITPFGAITHSMLVRELAADKQAIVSAVSTIGYCVLCIGLALLGWGTMSLAWANLGYVIIGALAYIPFRPAGMPWLPSFGYWRSIAHFGAGTLVANCTAAVNAAIPDLLLGKMGSAHQVGLLSRANSTVSIFYHAAGSTVTYGAVSYLSQAYHRRESLVPVLSRATSLLTGVGWPAFALTALLGTDIVVALYGAKWVDCVPAILPLAIAAGLTMLFQYAPAALSAIGRPYLGAVPVTVTLIARIGLGFLLYDGTLTTFAWAICLATALTVPVMVVQQRRHFDFGIRQFLLSLVPSTLVTVICTVAGVLLLLVLPDTLPSLARLVILLPPLTAAWYFALRLTGHELLGEVHHLAGGFKVRLARLIPVRLRKS